MNIKEDRSFFIVLGVPRDSPNSCGASISYLGTASTSGTAIVLEATDGSTAVFEGEYDATSITVSLTTAEKPSFHFVWTGPFP
jgi:hypothetical protein